MTDETIEHEGIVTQITTTHVVVSIKQQSACATCHAKNACGISEIAQKNIIAEKPLFPVNVGDKIKVYATIKHALFAVMWAYIVPSLLIISLLALFYFLRITEIFAATTTLIAICFYFFILYLLRDKFSRKIKFKINT